MTTHDRELKDGISQLAGVFGKDAPYVQYCTVDSVDEVKQTCDCTPISGDQDTQIIGVLLNSEANPGFTLFPAIDSTVIVAVYSKNIPFVILAEEIYKVLITINNTTVEITDGLTKFNGGINDGMILINPLIQKLNNLENKVNDIIEKYNAMTLPVSGATAGPPSIPITGELTPTVKSDVENTKITQ